MSSLPLQLFSHYPAWPAPFEVPLAESAEHPCPYFAERVAKVRGISTRSAPPDVYHDFMDAGFRRSGRFIYQPVCSGCRQCMPIRVPTTSFVPSKSQRRCWRRNQDLVIKIVPQAATSEKYELYERYATHWHSQHDVDFEQYLEFLYSSPVNSFDVEYRKLDGGLIAVGVCDLSRQSLSSVYFYFDRDQAHRSLGTFSALREIAYVREVNIPYYYLGYWIKGCDSMQYKSNFQPCELLGTDGNWRPIAPGFDPRDKADIIR